MPGPAVDQARAAPLAVNRPVKAASDVMAVKLEAAAADGVDKLSKTLAGKGTAVAGRAVAS
jgi:hypothetical protein